MNHLLKFPSSARTIRQTALVAMGSLRYAGSVTGLEWVVGLFFLVFLQGYPKIKGCVAEIKSSLCAKGAGEIRDGWTMEVLLPGPTKLYSRYRRICVPLCTQFIIYSNIQTQLEKNTVRQPLICCLLIVFKQYFIFKDAQSVQLFIRKRWPCMAAAGYKFSLPLSDVGFLEYSLMSSPFTSWSFLLGAEALPIPSWNTFLKNSPSR